MLLNHFKNFHFILVVTTLLIWTITGSSLVRKRNFFADSSRIAHGRPVTNCSYQVQVLSILKNNMAVICSGAIINHRWILSAAHCISSLPTPMAVLAGSQILFRASDERIYEVIERVKHPQFTDRGGIYYCDIGLLKVDRTIDFEPNRVEVINFRKSINVIEGTVLRVAGWGKSEENKNNIAIMETIMKVENNIACQLKGFHPLNEGHICASPVLTASMDCQGDSGGPVTDVNRKFVIGLVSFGYDSKCPSRYPSVYTKVAPYVPWITQVMQKDQWQDLKATQSPQRLTTFKTPRLPDINNTDVSYPVII